VQAGEGGCDLKIWISERERVFDENKQHLGVIDYEDFWPGFYCGAGTAGATGSVTLGPMTADCRFLASRSARTNIDTPRSANGLRNFGRTATFDKARLLPQKHLRKGVFAFNVVGHGVDDVTFVNV